MQLVKSTNGLVLKQRAKRLFGNEHRHQTLSFYYFFPRPLIYTCKTVTIHLGLGVDQSFSPNRIPILRQVY